MSKTPEQLSQQTKHPPRELETLPDPETILYGTREPPPIAAGNIFPIEWRVETEGLRKIYEAARKQSWTPAELPWERLDPAAFTLEQRYAIAYWFACLSVFDSSGPAVFARALIRTYEAHEEDPVRKCFFLIERDEVNHEEVCQRVIQCLTPHGPLGYEPKSALGKLAQNNIKWYFHNGARYWEGFKKGVEKYSTAILFTAFLMGEMAASTLFMQMHQNTTIPALKEAFAKVGQDEARHLRICLTLLKVVLPKLSDAEKHQITHQIRAGYVFLSGILYEPPQEFWELPETWLPAHRLLERVASEAGLGILSLEARRENWRTALLRMKGLVEPYAIEFPAIPEVGIDGKSVAFDPAEIVPVF